MPGESKKTLRWGRWITEFTSRRTIDVPSEAERLEGLESVDGGILLAIEGIIQTTLL